MASAPDSQQPCCLATAIAAKLYHRRTPPPPSAPRIPIPRTSSARLSESYSSSPSPPTSSSILYLAYGSNLSAATFLGRRGIRPLSQVNVSAPSLELVFDLPGMPYVEPCFANTRPRSIPKPPPGRPVVPVPDPPFRPPTHSSDKPRNPVWNKGLFGVVYEVTPDDYATIIATEGGGASYKDILVPCLALPPRVSVPEKPPIPEIPRPFLAHTLYMPTLSGLPDPDEPDKSRGDDDPVDDPRKKWYWPLVKPIRREDGYAQPSARYLKLITDGAAEHDLPDDYQAYLLSLQPYTATSARQRVGAAIITAVLGTFLPVIFMLGKRTADEQGRIPNWLALCMAALFNLVWRAYDAVLKPLFGDGERTQEEEDDNEARRRTSRVRNLRRGRGLGTDEEKCALMGQ